MDTKWVIIDVGCIECGEQTEVRAICSSQEEAERQLTQLCRGLGIIRGADLEFAGLDGKKGSSYIAKVEYFKGGQRALELHVFPPTPV